MATCWNALFCVILTATDKVDWLLSCRCIFRYKCYLVLPSPCPWGSTQSSHTAAKRGILARYISIYICKFNNCAKLTLMHFFNLNSTMPSLTSSPIVTLRGEEQGYFSERPHVGLTGFEPGIIAWLAWQQGVRRSINIPHPFSSHKLHICLNWNECWCIDGRTFKTLSQWTNLSRLVRSTNVTSSNRSLFKWAVTAGCVLPVSWGRNTCRLELTFWPGPHPRYLDFDVQLWSADGGQGNTSWHDERRDLNHLSREIKTQMP